MWWSNEDFFGGRGRDNLTGARAGCQWLLDVSVLAAKVVRSLLLSLAAHWRKGHVC